MNLRSIINRIGRTSWAAEVIAFLGGLVFFQRLWFFAHRLPSVIDEGMYLHKGFLFASGRYLPFQDYGPWTDHMPFAFLIPGYTQLVFGLGLRTGRFYAIGLALLLLLGIWLVAKRIGGKWWAAFAIWVFALNPVLAQMYSAAASQVLAATLLIWMLVFSLGSERPLWQLLISAILASTLFLSRINMLPVPFLLVLYIYLQHGKKPAVISALVSAAIIIGVHIALWPNILKMWGEVMPIFLEPYAMPTSGLKAYEPDFSFTSRIVSFFSGIRFHFVSVVGFIFAILSLKSMRTLEKRERMLDFGLVFSVYLVLFLAHGLASIYLSYCVSCFPNYLGFFSGLGILLLIFSAPHLFKRPNQTKPWMAYSLMLILFLGILFGAKGGLLPRLIASLTAIIRRLPIPIGRFGFLFGTVVTLLLFVVVLVGIIWLTRWLEKRLKGDGLMSTSNFGSLLLVTFLVTGWLLSPTFIFSEGHRGEVCGGDVIASFEEIGGYLSEVIPDGSKLYWRVSTPVPLLYLPNVELFPSQLSGAYSMRIGGDAEELEKYGFWNEELGKQWILEADYYLSDQAGEGYPSDLPPGAFSELPSTPAGVNCRPDVAIRIFVRN